MLDNLKILVQPISESSPCGEDLRYDLLYDQIRHARYSEDPNLPQGVWQRKVTEADWGQVEQFCVEGLKSRSKDLQIASWLLESQFYLYHLEGLLQGLKLLKKLCEMYWEDMHPTLENEMRYAPFDWLNEKFSNTLQQIPLQDKEIEERPISLADYTFAETHEAAQDKPDIKKIVNTLQTGKPSFYQALSENAQDCIRLCQDIESFCKEKTGTDRVSLYRIRKILEKLVEVSQTLKPKNIIEKVLDKPKKKPEKKGADMSVEGREEAYQKIQEIADYLEQIEPHSPTPYLLRKALAWGNMNLQELLSEFAKLGMSFEQVQAWIGLPGDKKKAQK